MATLLDALVVSLSLDPSQFTEGQKKAAESLRQTRISAEGEGKKIEESGKRAGEFFTTIKKKALEFLAVFTAGMGTAEFLKFLTDADTQLGRLAERFGISARALGAWGAASQALGGSAAATESTITGLISKFAQMSITGDTTLVPWVRALGIQLKTTADGTLDWQDALIKLSEAVQRMPRAQATTFLQDMGFDAGTITLLEQGPAAVRKLLQSFQSLQPSAADRAAAEERTKDWTALWQTWVQMGRFLVTTFEPQIHLLLTRLTDLAKWATAHPHVLELALGLTAATIAALTAATGPLGMIVVALAAIVAAVTWLIANTDTAAEHAERFSNRFRFNQTPGAPDTGGHWEQLGNRRVWRQDQGSTGGSVEHEAYIRSTAAQLGIDPNVAAAVARSEGLGSSGVGDRGSSFGDFQLHVGGIASGGNAGTGVGDEFSRQTGLDPSDPANWKAMDLFALQWAKTHGWGAWHGWRGSSFAGIGAGAGGGGGSGSRSVTIGSLNVYTSAPNATGIVRDIRAALQRQLQASMANGSFA